MLEAIRQINKRFPEISLNVRDVEEFLRKFGLNRDEDISYSQFLAATLTHQQLTSTNIRQLFNYLAVFETGFINKDTLAITFQRKGRSLQTSEVASMISELGFDADVNIDYDTFERLVVQDFVTDTGIHSTVSGDQE